MDLNEFRKYAAEKHNIPDVTTDEWQANHANMPKLSPDGACRRIKHARKFEEAAGTLLGARDFFYKDKPLSESNSQILYLWSREAGWQEVFWNGEFPGVHNKKASLAVDRVEDVVRIGGIEDRGLARELAVALGPDVVDQGGIGIARVHATGDATDGEVGAIVREIDPPPDSRSIELLERRPTQRLAGQVRERGCQVRRDRSRAVASEGEGRHE